MAARISVAEARKLGWLDQSTGTQLGATVTYRTRLCPTWWFTCAGCGLHVTVAGQISQDIPQQCMRCREVQRCMLK